MRMDDDGPRIVIREMTRACALACRHCRAEAHPHRNPDKLSFVFVSRVGEIQPSGFLPFVCGNVREQRLIDMYRDHPTMRRPRNPDSFDGKCGLCGYKTLCGGAGGAYGVTGDPFAAEPCCSYVSRRAAALMQGATA